MSQSVPKNSVTQGFSLLEVTVALAVLSIALLAAAALTGKVMGGGQSSKYMSMAATLSSEKLEDLNRWDGDNPQICVPTGSSSVGSLTSDVLQTTTCESGASATVNYYDDVSMSLTVATDCPGGSAGCFAETVSSISAGNTVYTTTYHSPDGTISTSTSATAPATSTFHRRWIIESNPVVKGISLICPSPGPATCLRRTTVLVTALDQSVQPPVSFQMSSVQP
ncbi:MAG TPA: prepilin-type N-terminal cleavage/methylation domain-containing protein [Terriglobia bacterium]|nr:prepilin-type N-terminal cleavage/methylation domain-containing protein [Terriglobia bacterium]